MQFDRTRGWPPADVMRNLFPEDEIRAQAANHAFERSFRAAVDRFGVLPLPGLNEALAKLSAAGIGLPDVLPFQARDEPGRGAAGLGPARRPGAVRGRCGPRLSVARPRSSPRFCGWGSAACATWVTVTATEGGVLAAQRAGARLIVGVLSDMDDASRLRRAGATHLLADIGELPDLVASQGGITTSD